MSIGQEMYDLCVKMFPYCRSITGNGVRKTLGTLKEVYDNIKIYEVPSGTQVFDWTVPKEWNIRDAWIKNSAGEKIIDFNNTNLHVMGYSLPLDREVSLDELKKMIYTQPDQPDVIPYVTSYYKERSGFCMTETQKQSLPDDTYHVYIDSEEEILLSTYVCHPSMANNELSGPSVTIHLAKWLSSLKKRRYTYRIVFIPETIGSITYLSRNLDIMKKNTIAGFNISCVGDDRTFSYISSRYGTTLADRVAKNVLDFYYPDYKKYTFLNRGSDERQYNAPGVDLPVCAICRSKYGEYPEYHTSKDNLELISPSGLDGAYQVYQQCIQVLEANYHYQIQCLCEPQLGKRGLYPTISQKGSYDEIRAMTNFIAYADGSNDLIDISNIIGEPAVSLLPIIDKLQNNDLLKAV